MLIALLTAVALATGPYAIVLGVAQDAGHPQAGCTADHCSSAWVDATKRHHPASLGLVSGDDFYLIDATPALPDQLHTMQVMSEGAHLRGIFLTHGHMGHYTGLAHLGREVMGAQQIPVFAMPRMAALLTNNAPWELLVRLNNIHLRPLSANAAVDLGDLRVTPLRVPHRDEYTETVGYLIQSEDKSALYLPDIDRWEQWDHSLEAMIKEVDVAWIDATFFSGGELGGRDMRLIPHPTIELTMDLLAELARSDKAKVHFIHMNHTNPALNPDSPEHKRIIEAGFHIATQGDQFSFGN